VQAGLGILCRRTAAKNARSNVAPQGEAPPQTPNHQNPTQKSATSPPYPQRKPIKMRGKPTRTTLRVPGTGNNTRPRDPGKAGAQPLQPADQRHILPTRIGGKPADAAIGTRRHAEIGAMHVAMPVARSILMLVTGMQAPVAHSP